MTHWHKQRQERQARLAAAAQYSREKFAQADGVTAPLEALIRAGGRVCLEGDNQNQIDFMARAMVAVNSDVAYDLPIAQSVITLPRHLNLFEPKIEKNLEYWGRCAEFGAVRTALLPIHTRGIRLQKANAGNLAVSENEWFEAEAEFEPDPEVRRDELGAGHGGRTKAFDIARKVTGEALGRMTRSPRRITMHSCT